MNAPCTLCGSRLWPIKDDPCPLCRTSERDEDEVEDDRRYDDSEDRMINGCIHGARSHRHDATISRFDD